MWLADRLREPVRSVGESAEVSPGRSTGRIARILGQVPGKHDLPFDRPRWAERLTRDSPSNACMLFAPLSGRPPSMAFRADFRSGSRTVLPLLPPAATVALAVGVAGPLAGLTTLQTVSLSVLTYFPSVMLTALELIDAAVPTLSSS